jgi:quinol monooxygenase YgiN
MAILLARTCFRVKPYKRAEVLSAVDETVERMRRASSCRHCQLLVDSEDANTFCLLSEWRSASDADEFFSSREFQIFRHIRILLQEEPVILLDQVEARETRVIEAR